jgi:ABC-type amino acid transport substrate-binding protein
VRPSSKVEIPQQKEGIVMKKLLLYLLSAACVQVTLKAEGPSACGTNFTQLVAGSDFAGEAGWPPFEVSDPENSTVTGFDAAVLCEVAHRCGFAGPAFRQVAFENLLPTLTQENSPIDIALSAMSITGDRINTDGVAFVKYNEDSLGLVFAADNEGVDQFIDPNTVLQQLSDLAGEEGDITIGVIRGSRQFNIIDSGSYPGLVPLERDTLDILLEDLAVGGVDALVDALLVDGPTAVALEIASQDEPFKVVALDNVLDTQNVVPSQGLGIAVNAECCQLYANIQQAINDMNADGTLARFREEFGVQTGFIPVAGLVPDSCAQTTATIDSNVIANYLFTKYCPCNPTVIQIS